MRNYTQTQDDDKYGMERFVPKFRDLSRLEQQKALEKLDHDMDDLGKALKEDCLAVCEECLKVDRKKLITCNAWCGLCYRHLCSHHAGGKINWYFARQVTCNDGSKTYSACTTCEHKYGITHEVPSYYYAE